MIARTQTRTAVLALCGVIASAGAAYAQAVDNRAEALWTFFLLLLGIVVAFVIVFIPTFVAFHRAHPNRWVIFVINLALGGTVIGWFAALIWAMMGVHRTKDAQGSHGGESGLNIFANDPLKVRIDPTPGLPSAFAPPPLTASPAAPPAPDLIDRLERLKRLHDSGAIDDDQFRHMRDRLIAEAR